MKKDKQQIFNKLWQENKLTELRGILLEWLKEEHDSHWTLAQIAEINYLEKHFTEALEYAEKAWKIAPHCPMVIWEYAESLFRLGKNEEAEPLYRNLIRRRVKRIAYGECGEGIRATRMLVNDCRYPLGCILAIRVEFKIAEKYVKQHIANRNRNCTSLFRIHEVKLDLEKIRQGKKPYFENEVIQ